jgi:hypothetical protein
MKINTYYDTILKKLKEFFPEKTLIPYAYDLSDKNNHLFLENGYGVSIGGQRFEQLDFCRLTLVRTIDVILTREVVRLDSDTQIIHEETKKMLNDVYKVQSEFYSYSELDIPDKILKVDVLGSTEIEEVLGDKAKFLAIRVNFDFWIDEFIKE